MTRPPLHRVVMRSRASRVAAALLLIISVAALGGPELAVWDAETIDWDALESPPDRNHWFGTDLVGRDLFVRTLLGARTSLAIALVATTISVLIGVPWGAAAGYIGGTTDQIMMRIVDALYGLPFILIVILLVVLFGRNPYLLFAALGAIYWLDIARIVRGQTLVLRAQPFIDAARILGATTPKILWRHILPNVAGPALIYATLTIPGVILAESFISFLGLGVQEPDTSWGVLISDATASLESAPWMLLFPGGALVATVWACNLLGDRLRDALDHTDNRTRI